ncbi:ABC transporter permease [Alicyclobacillus mali (ex Roth et al. 2021)]|uniref:ABC transporter permease n=1 Tax=Alicyclobacillus mali (ex Roth et al. 2021) TaxID=1123961 RepID=UPI00082A3A57|nr:ABC transporter permease [Alicyclobacillus mali (ex Roth et al. 2021)]
MGHLVSASTTENKMGSTRFRMSLRSALNASLVFGGLIALVVVFSVLSKSFLTFSNIFQILQQVAVVGILSIGQAFVIITAGIDMSQGSVIDLVGIMTGLLLEHHYPIWISMVAGLLIGAATGFVNGLLITLAKIPPFIATLGTMSIDAGIALIIPNGQPVFGIPQSVYNFGNGGVLKIVPNIALLMIVLAIAFHFVLSKTKFGRCTYAVGSNPLAARLSGMQVNRHIIFVYILSGVLSAVGGIVMLAWVNSAMPDMGTNYQLNSIAAVVIGGASLFGGEGTVWGSMIGALLMAVLANGSQLVGISSYWQSVLLGIVVVLAVFIDGFRRRSAGMNA